MQQSLSLKKNDGTTTVVFSLRSSNGTAAEYMDPASSSASPTLLRVSHALKPVGSKGSDRHTILNQAVVLDSLGQPHVCSVSTTITVPRNPVITEQIIKDQLAYNRNYLALAGCIDAIIDGITY